MSRPATRSKNKRQRQVENDDTTTEILRKIHLTGEITDDDVNQLYMITKPVCQGCRVNTKDNPNCFCGLTPPPNGSRKTGLWQKMSDIIQTLGPDPCKDLRASAHSPAGLTNLGATCYANSILQCLYMNKSFRQGVFSVEPDVLIQHPVVDQLARLFAQLHASRMAFIDSAPFIKTLELDNGVQQDSHEFLTLLFSLLERCLSDSKVLKARTIVQDLFRGSVSHVTTCSKCGKDSEASLNMEDFYELELNVKGLKTLDESLTDYLSIEELHGDNQYFCESCNTRVDASRSIKLRTLPDVLNFQLKRYDFLQKTTSKKKITSVFSFPGKLDMRERLSKPSRVELIYDLSAVLIHKGTATNSGHYIAHIKDENTGKWWEFDDENVSNLGHHPFGEGSSTSNTKSDRTGPVHSSCIGVDGTANGNHLDPVKPQHEEFSGGSHVEMFSSTDAYMLMYNLSCAKKNGGSTMEREGDAVVLHDGISLPSHLCEEIANLNSLYVDACEQFKLKKKRELEHLTASREEVRSVLYEAPVHSVEEPFYWISTDWLHQWADNISPPVINNASIQCSHGKLPISKAGSVKRLSTEAWTKLFSKYNGGPTFSKDDYCMDCLIDVAHTVVCADGYRDRRKLMKEIADDVLSAKCEDGAYYVSKAWLQQWVKRKNLDAPSEADAGPTMSIRCSHGHLMPEQAAGAKRLLVPEKLWLFFYEDAVTVKPDDRSGCPTFPSDAEDCPECSNALSEVACLEDFRREMKLKQRQNHEKLAMGKSIPLSSNCKYYLLPSSWLSKWRSYISTSSKHNSSMESEILDGIINLLKCEKHLRLLERSPKVAYKRGSFFQKDSSTDRLTIITEHDWECFCEEWGGTKENGISAMIEHSNDLAGCCGDMPTCEQQLNLSNEVNNEIESKQPVIRTCPEVCEECIGERESCELMEKLHYADEEIYVYLVRGKEAPKSILQASQSSEPDRRASKRSRRKNSENLVNLKVSATTSLYQLKMMIWESLGVVKENQILHKGSRIIDQETATLADMNIFPGDKLWVKDSEIHEDRDIADELSDQKMNVENMEEGFRGTLLTSNISSQVV
ncbi:Ubiquitin carboxyl-terminal hydrolase 26 [Hibiscus syriacus]|uniref:Ubiquitin carboxyl-terminal hydrolase 26 n=1 Tax=Hibiscus syriacus TaxID=106335 RepID=A0A6A2Y941_HIBSY|nr:ubiquitin carboxyl-terminal hydrolase 26-like isoform X2 [Hibiscus syriacus]KAE8678665.1 Ubiquitin carboxyl-terminal hydrolase 26 [Hibiscus syriacus]